MDEPALWIALVTGLFSCLFAANNVALHHFSRAKLEERLRGGENDERIRFIVEHRAALVLLTAVGRATCNLIVMMGVMVLFDPLSEGLHWPRLLGAFVTAATILSVLSVAVPMSWGLHAPEALLAACLPVLRLSLFVLKPFIVALHWFDPLVRRLLGVNHASLDPAVNIGQEILEAVSEGEKSGLVDESQAEMIEAVVEFPTTTAGQIMTPRTDIEGISVDSTLQQTKQYIDAAGHSRFPVYEGSLDHIIGILYVKDLLKLVGDHAQQPFNLRDHVREALFVPETVQLRDLLADFRKRKVHVAVVLDEYGGTAGLVTIEDIVEEIVGEIQDEYEPAGEEEPRIERIDEFTAQVDGRVYIDDLNDALNLTIPEDEDYDTVGGFAFANFGHIPEAGESFDFQNVRITVVDAEKTRINRLKIEVLDRAATGNGNGE